MNVILASNSPRRRELLKGLDIPFEVRVLEDVSENYPDYIKVDDIAEFIAKQKSIPYTEIVEADDVVITADTVVVVDNNVLGKPANREEAIKMLQRLSGKTHKVITGVCFTSKHKQHSFSVTTKVTFKMLTIDEITYYIDTYLPFDKAGAYGIQEWIGYIGVTNISGSYFNVVGFPVQRIYSELQAFHAKCL